MRGPSSADERDWEEAGTNYRGSGDPEMGPAPEIFACVLIFSRSFLAGGPEKIVWLGPLPAPGVPGLMSTQQQAHCTTLGPEGK